MEQGFDPSMMMMNQGPNRRMGNQTSMPNLNNLGQMGFNQYNSPQFNQMGMDFQNPMYPNQIYNPQTPMPMMMNGPQGMQQNGFQVPLYNPHLGMQNSMINMNPPNNRYGDVLKDNQAPPFFRGGLDSRPGVGMSMNNLNNTENRGRENLPISKPSGRGNGISGIMKNNDQNTKIKKISYMSDLQKQVQMKEQAQMEKQQIQRESQVKNAMERLQNDWFGRQGAGAPNKDSNGQIVATRKRPLNPNAMSVDWFTGGAASLTPQQQMEAMQYLGVQKGSGGMQQQGQLRAPQSNDMGGFQMENQSTISVNQNNDQFNNNNRNRSVQQNIPNINVFPPSTTNRRDQSPNFAAQNLNNNNNMNLPPLIAPDLNEIHPGSMNAEIVDKLKKRQQALQLQQEQLLQIENKRRAQQYAQLDEKRQREIQEVRVRQQKEEKEQRMMMEFAEGRTQGFNLHQTNFDVKTFQKSFYGKKNMQDSQVMMTTQTDLKSQSKRPRTPVQEVVDGNRKIRQERDRIQIEQRIIKELPIEITMQVKDAVSVELIKLRNEMNFQQNSLGEQLLQLKGQVMQTNEKRARTDEELQNIREDLHKTQVVDEIRQRELYNAFILTKKPEIVSENTQKLIDPELVKFVPPRRPRPYYQMTDPYLNNNNDLKHDIHQILRDESTLLPLNSNLEKGQIPRYDAQVIEENYFNEDDDQKYMGKLGLHIDHDPRIDLPDDFTNRQNLYIPSMKNDEFSLKDILKKNDERLEQLNEINYITQNRELDNLDRALFSFVENASVKNKNLTVPSDDLYLYNTNNLGSNLKEINYMSMDQFSTNATENISSTVSKGGRNR